MKKHLSPKTKYPSDLKDAEWKKIEPLLPKAKSQRGGRPVEYSKREILNAIFYINRGGCSWRMMPGDFPPYMIVYTYFCRWRNDGTWKRIHDTLGRQLRRAKGKKSEPSASILDSQSIDIADQAGERGYDAGKKVKGRKRHILVDTLGIILLLTVTAASVQDREGAKQLLQPLENTQPRLTKIWADGGYSGEDLSDWVSEIRDDEQEIELEIVKRNDDVTGFKVLPHRWIVERTFAWLMKYRRLVRDYEVRIDSSESMIYIAMIRRMTKNLAKK